MSSPFPSSLLKWHDSLEQEYWSDQKYPERTFELRLLWVTAGKSNTFYNADLNWALVMDHSILQSLWNSFRGCLFFCAGQDTVWRTVYCVRSYLFNVKFKAQNKKTSTSIKNSIIRSLKVDNQLKQKCNSAHLMKVSVKKYLSFDF